MKYLVYTCVVGDYDRVYPPVVSEPGIDYVIFTDDPTLSVSGWRTRVVDPARFGSARLMNRYFKMLVHRECPDYVASLYVDGNIRLLGNLFRLFNDFCASKAALGFFRHPVRSTAMAEVEACIGAGKAEADTLLREQAAYRHDGFADDAGLIEAGIILKRHGQAGLEEAMDLWWALFKRYQTRDQVSLPYVLWKTRPPLMFHGFDFRQPNPYFGLYPHVGTTNVRPAYAHLYARAYDSLLHKLLLRAWQLYWEIKRSLRS